MTNNTSIHSLDGSKENAFPLNRVIVFILAALVTGTLVGFAAAKLSGGKSADTAKNSPGSAVSTSENTAGIADKKTFKDSVVGILKEGGIDGEGNFHIERPGGISQNAYLTSSTVDLSQYIGKKIKVWGQTFKGQKAGWLMDVGLVEVLK